MSVAYRAVGWNRQKRRYDGILLSAAATMLLVLVAGGALVNPHATIETLLIRGFAITAFILLHIILSIGPLCRLDPRFLPLLYNRRHLGVTMFTCALVHGAFAVVQFHAFGNTNAIISVLTTSTAYASVSDFPFQVLGLAALGVLFLMAATSHDFWLHNLTAPVWKALHMGVYIAYALIVAHVAFGALQSERSPWLSLGVALGVVWVLGLHVAAALREQPRDRPADGGSRDPDVAQRNSGSDVAQRFSAATRVAEPFRAAEHTPTLVDVCGVAEIPDTRAVVRCVSGERVAIFRYGNNVSAISNVCQHQNGPLGEGKIVNGCVVCPWHGYEYFPDSGASPPPFTEKVPTFTVHVRDGRVLIDPTPHAPGTRVEPARIA